jgi:hypothetical protein
MPALPKREYCYLSDASVLSLPSLIGDEFLKFDKEQEHGKSFSFVLRGLEGRRGSKELESYVQRVVCVLLLDPAEADVAWEERTWQR